MNKSRRNFFKRFAAIASMAAMPAILNNNIAKAKISSRIQKTGNPLRVPAQWKGSVIMVYEGNTQLWQENKTKTYIMNNYPGQTIRTKQGDLFEIRMHNMLKENIAIHWHGIVVPADMDGHPKDAFVPNDLHTYKYPIKQRAGTYFYHSHTHQRTGEHVNRGMFGAFIVEDDEEKALNLPSGSHEVLLAIQDVQIDNNYQIVYEPFHLDKMSGWLGNTIIVNGTPNAYLSVSADHYRIRIINASNARIYKLAFEDDSPFYVIASDGGLLEKPVEVSSLMLGPAERYEIIFDFSKYPVGNSVKMLSRKFDFPEGAHGNPLYPQGVEYDIIRFDIDNEKQSEFIMPEKLSKIERYNPSDAINTRQFVLKMDAVLQMRHTINNVLFDMYRIDMTIPFGEMEIWEFINRDENSVHPMHIHGVQFQILSRNGSTDIAEWERGWKDTFMIGPVETVRLLVKFTEYEGIYLVHCHNLEHEDDGMMINVDVKSTTGLTSRTSENRFFEIYPNPANDYINIYLYKAIHSEYHIKLIDIHGVLAIARSFPGNNNILKLDLKGIASGSYIVRCEYGDSEYSLPLLVSR